jgi:hypothetical protein
MVTDKLERLDFSIPDFFRTIWVSEHAKDTWESRIHAIASNWPYIERATLTQGLRDGILQTILPQQLPEVQNWAFEKQIPMVILGLDGETGLPYGNAAAPYQEGRPFSYRIYFGKAPENFQKYWKESNQLAIGRALGYPPCCIEFFTKYWKGEGWHDLTYLSYDDPNQKNLMYNNILLRSLGVRAVSHLPCSVNCKPSIRIGMDVFSVMEKCGHQAEIIEWMKTLLSMPMKWSSLHGIAITTTPLFKLINATDPLPSVADLHLASDYYPLEGASGVLFPFQKVQHLKLSKSKDTDFLDNGFGSRSAMEAAHRFIISMIPKELSGGIATNVLDLGCGNGRLLQSIKKLHPYVTVYGVDTKSMKFDGFTQVDIYDYEWEGQYELVLMSVERLHEVDKEVASDLLQAIRLHSKYLLLSTYNNWMHGFDHVIDKLFSVVSVGLDPALGYEAKLLERKI